MIILKKWFISKNYISDAAFKPNFVNFNYLNSARPKCGSLKQYNKTQKAWKKKKLLFPEMRVTRKIFTRAVANFFFNFFSGNILFSSLVSSASFVFLLCFFFSCLFLKYIFWYTFDYASGWVIKNFYSPGFRKQDYFFLA